MLDALRKAFSGLTDAIAREREIGERELEKRLEDLEIELIKAGTALEAVDLIKERVKGALLGKKVRGREDVERALREALKGALFVGPPLFPPEERPEIIMFVGPNGAGKTTTIGKLARLLRENGYLSVLAAADTFRAGSIEQLEEWGRRVGVKVIKHTYGADPAAVAYDARAYAEKRGIHYVLIDTAGRQETSRNLMEELKKIKRVVRPRYIVFVGEALAGNALFDQIRGFDNALGVDSVILTKFDLDVKGGAAFTVAAAGKGISYVGVGQGEGDLLRFSPDIVLDRIFPF